MGFDLFQSRRNYNEPCKWWSRNEDDQYEDSDLIIKRVPTGTFMAKEVAPEQLKDTVIANSFMFEQGMITIKSPDNLMGIKSKDLVEFQGEHWIVVNVQKSKAKMQNTQYASNKYCSHYWYLELRK